MKLKRKIFLILFSGRRDSDDFPDYLYGCPVYSYD